MNSKKIDCGILISFFVGAAEWWFLSLSPSSLAVLIASLLLFFLFLGFCILAVVIPAPEKRKGQVFVPLRPINVDRPKELTLQW